MDNLTEYRLANAKEKLESAKLLLDAGKYKDSIGRSYQSMCSQHFKSVTVVIMMISLLLPGKMQRNSIRKRKNCMKK